MWMDQFDNPNGDFAIMATGGSNAAGQVFTADGTELKTATFSLKKVGSPSGYLRAELYAITGTPGTNAVPTGSPLATSEYINIVDIGTSYSYFHFSFSTPYATVSGTKYAVVIQAAGTTTNGTNRVVLAQNSSGGHAGNRVNYDNFIANSWQALASADIVFYAYGSNPGERYLRATGNWNGPVWTNDRMDPIGIIGSAPPPTGDDSVYIQANFTVTLTANATCYSLYTSSGRINMAGYKIDAELDFTMQSTLDMGGGTVEVTNGEDFPVSYIGTVLNPGLTRVTASNLLSGGGDITLGDGSYGDFQLNLGVGSGGTIYNITGSPTFRSLIIQSKNSAAHTVNFDGNIQVDKFIAIGSSTSNRLTLNAPSPMIIGDDYLKGTVYGQFVNMGANVLTYDSALSYSYIGSNSVDNTGGYWLTQDPPKISTLVDPLTTAPGSNPNWTLPPYPSASLPTLTSGGAADGGYRFDSTNEGIMSQSTYDIVNNDIVFEIMNATSMSSRGDFYIAIGALTGQKVSVGMGVTGIVDPSIILYLNNTGLVMSTTSQADFVGGVPSPKFYVKVRYSSVDEKFYVSHSTNGSTWLDETGSTETFDSMAIEHLRSSRIMMHADYTYATDVYNIGSINILPVSKNPGAFLQFF